MSSGKYYVRLGDMDSGLGSDEDRKGSVPRATKEQKQLHNQQLLSGCFIDAASLSDDCELAGSPGPSSTDQRRHEERRQGALIFSNAIPQFSMLQINENFPDTSTPYNSIVQLTEEPAEEVASTRKSPLGFYVDLSSVPETAPKTPSASSAKKNIFSMVIDFEAPKKDKPKLGALGKKARMKSGLLGRHNGSLSSSVSSINSTGSLGIVPGHNLQEEEQTKTLEPTKTMSLSSSSSELAIGEEVEENEGKAPAARTEKENLLVQGEIRPKAGKEKEPKLDSPTTVPSLVNPPPAQQFVKLSDLECQKPRMDLIFTPKMSRSIPESSWVESPLFMSRSAGYRSAPRPLEPDHTTDLSDSNESLTGTKANKSVQRLGTDLLRMFLEQISPDVTVEVDGHKLRAHKCILASRCQYFAALLSGHWLEASGNVISLQGFSYDSVYFSLLHIYSGASHVPDSISLVELASLADMLSLEGLKEVVEHALKQRHCHNFHRPCAGCCTGVLEVLPLSAAYGIDDLYQKCLAWITQHFVRIWPSRAFASLPRELRDKCYQQHVVHMTPDKVLSTILDCDKVLNTLPSLRWAEHVSQLVVQLSDACHLYHRQHFAQVLQAPSFLGLDSGLGWKVVQVEEQILSAGKNLGVEQACRSYTRVCKMLDQTWSRPFNDLLNKIKLVLEQCLVGQSDKLIRSNAWLRLDTVLRTRIKELSPNIEPVSRLPRATSSGINRKVAAKPPIKSPSSSDSSRNSSPSVTKQTPAAGRGAGSPSLRRSLLLAAKAPQVPPSPSTQRRSTLTQPTAASAAKSAQSRNLKPTVTKTKMTQSFSGRAASTPLKKSASEARKPTQRAASPLKKSSSGVARAASPIKPESPRKTKGGPPPQAPPLGKTKSAPTIQRSDTFLKDEPAIIGKIL